MRFLPTRFHAVLDYLVGLIVIALPIALQMKGAGFVALIDLGLFVIVYSLLTDYELGAVQFLRIRFHLVLDAAFGFAMLIAPLIFDFPPAARWTAYPIGILSIVLSLTTRPRALGTAS